MTYKERKTGMRTLDGEKREGDGAFRFNWGLGLFGSQVPEALRRSQVMDAP